MRKVGCLVKNCDLRQFKREFYLLYTDKKSDVEILNFVLNFALKGDNSSHITAELLREFGSFEAVFSADKSRFSKFNAIDDYCLEIFSLLSSIVNYFSEDLAEKKDKSYTIHPENTFIYNEKTMKDYFAKWYENVSCKQFNLLCLDENLCVVLHFVIEMHKATLADLDFDALVEIVLSSKCDCVLISHSSHEDDSFVIDELTKRFDENHLNMLDCYKFEK